MELARNVRHYYLTHFDQLPTEKQFHFAGRLAAWHDDPECQMLLVELKDKLVGPDSDIRSALHELIEHPTETPINAAETRAPYFAKYPELRGYLKALFRVRHLLTVYGIDARAQLLSLVPYEKLHELSLKLASDDEALRILSTYAINYLFLVEEILFDEHRSTIDLSKFYELGNDYDTSNQEGLLLLIYLYTHCIIGDSNFYDRPIGPDRLDDYSKMLQQLEMLIDRQYDDINLDNKLEFLVCTKICGYATTLFERVYEECSKSISPHGSFLIDTVNHVPQTNKTSFVASEHRNVLFIMSTTAWKHQPSSFKTF